MRLVNHGSRRVPVDIGSDRPGDQEGESSLFAAACRGDSELGLQLLNAGANFAMENKVGFLSNHVYYPPNTGSFCTVLSM